MTPLELALVLCLIVRFRHPLAYWIGPPSDHPALVAWRRR